MSITDNPVHRPTSLEKFMIDDEIDLGKLKMSVEQFGMCNTTNANPCREIDLKRKVIVEDYSSIIHPNINMSYSNLFGAFKSIMDMRLISESNKATFEVNFISAKISVNYQPQQIPSYIPYVPYDKPDKQKIIKLSPEQYCKITVNFLTELVSFTEQGIDVFTDMFKCELEESVKDLLSKFNIGEHNGKS